MALIVNLFGSPSAGKSTQAAGLFYKLKMRGIQCELITEKAKDLTWEQNFTALNHQLFVSGNQVYRQERVENKVDVVITDSPILLGLFYNTDPNQETKKLLEKLLLSIFKRKDNINVWINRKHNYNTVGRNQNEEEATAISEKISKFLDYHKIPVITIDGTVKGLEEIFNLVLRTLNE